MDVSLIIFNISTLDIQYILLSILWPLLKRYFVSFFLVCSSMFTPFIVNPFLVLCCWNWKFPLVVLYLLCCPAFHPYLSLIMWYLNNLGNYFQNFGNIFHFDFIFFIFSVILLLKLSILNFILRLIFILTMVLISCLYNCPLWFSNFTYYMTQYSCFYSVSCT